MNQDDSCTNMTEYTNMGDEPKESERFMNQSGKCIKSIHKSKYSWTQSSEIYIGMTIINRCNSTFGDLSLDKE